MYQALYRKWRSKTFDEVVGQQHVTDTLKHQVASGRLSHAYLFTGTRGTGKTSCAKILARAVNCQNPQDGNPCNQCPACLGIENGSILDVLELDAASNNGVDQVRALRDEAVYTPAAVRKRVYIVDEVHMLSTAAFNALLKILEEPPAHLMFILATTELHKVPATIKSRCQQYAFKRILPGDIAAHLSKVAAAEQIDLTPEAAALIARLADGGMRDAMSLLDQCSGLGGRVDENEVLSVLGLAGNLETAALMERLAAGDAAGALEALGRLYANGKKVDSLLGELSALARDLLIRKTAPTAGAALMTGGYDENTMRSLAERLSAARLVGMLSLIQSTAAELPRSANQRTDAELCLMRLADPALDGSVTGLIARVERLEAALVGGTPIPAAPAAAPAPAPVREAPAPSAKPAVAGDRPPWDEPEVPVEPKPAPAPKRREPAPVPQADPAAKAASSAPPSAALADGSFWPGLVAGLRGKVGFAEYPFLSNPALVQGVLEGDKLTIWVDSEMTKVLLNKPAVSDQVARMASARLGRTIHIFYKVGKAPAPAPAPEAVPAEEVDALEALLADSAEFDNIIVTE